MVHSVRGLSGNIIGANTPKNFATLLMSPFALYPLRRRRRETREVSAMSGMLVPNYKMMAGAEFMRSALMCAGGFFRQVVRCA